MSSLRQKALKLLTRREHSRFELAQKLEKLGSPEEITAVLDHLEQTGLLSDQRAAATYLASHAARFGAAKLKYALRAKGIAAELIEQCLEENLGSEEARALEVWRRKFAHPPADARDWAKQARFLQSRGFSTNAITKTLKATEDDDA
ncbi:MAG TPA: recombination regulator RecX [Rhodocyclaceae bacterium]|nr:recombination regulator RecX [Rhodocyclaceae bacterium]